MFLALLIPTLCLSTAAFPRWLTGARVVTRWGVATRQHPAAPLTVTPGARGGGNGSGSSTGDPTAGRPQGPDPLPGRRVSIRPQPTRAPRGEAMAVNPL